MTAANRAAPNGAAGPAKADATAGRAPSPPGTSITGRVVAVKLEIRPVAKNGYNSHGKYKHSTIDDVYHEVRPLLAKHGLDLRTTIEEYNVTKVPRDDGRGDGTRLDFTFSMGFDSVDGDTEPRDIRYLSLPLTGPQTFEIAQSFAAKQYLRARLQLETGDFESEDPLGPGASGSTGGTTAAPPGRARFRVPDGLRRRSDEVILHLSPDEVQALNLAIEQSATATEMSAAVSNAERMVARRRAPEPTNGGQQRRAPAPAKPAAQPSDPQAAPPDDGWLHGTAHKLGEDGEGNPEWGALIVPRAGETVTVGARVKVAMKSRQGRQRHYVTQIIEQLLAGIVVATRPLTAAEERAENGQ